MEPSGGQVKYGFARKLKRYFALCFTKINPIFDPFHILSAIKQTLSFESLHLVKKTHATLP